MKPLARTALAAFALAASVTFAQAQSPQDHEAHHPSPAPTDQTAPSPGPNAGGPAGMMDHGSQGMTGGAGMMGHQDMKEGCPGMMQGGASPMDPAMRQMHQSMMDTPVTGDTDHDFAALMVPHHQAAIDMAQAELKNGKDPQLRKLALKIIASQGKEIKDLQAWLAKAPAK